MTQIPSVGRIVHYLSRGSLDGRFPPAHRAAIVTEVHHEGNPDSLLSLCILNPTGMFFDIAIHPDQTASLPGTWHWPEYVGEAAAKAGITKEEAIGYLKLTEEE